MLLLVQDRNNSC